MAYSLAVSGAYLTITFDTALTANQQYTITLLAGISGIYGSDIHTMKSDYTFWFTSTYCPLFTTLTKVKLNAGPAADSLLDDTIYRLIHKNSLDAVDLYNAYFGTRVAYDHWGCTWHNVPISLRQYVECKTAYDILALIELAATDNGLGAGGQLKTLGDMTIRYDGRSNNRADGNDPGRKKQLYDCWQEALQAIRTRGILPAVRGWYDVTKGYPHPAWDTNHNRVIRTVDFQRSDPAGPWEPAPYWRANI